jgi:cysteine-rich repeat protein
METVRNVLALAVLLATGGCGARSALPEPFIGPCGDGHLDPGEQCDLGADNVDRPAILLKQGAFSTGVRPIDRASSVVAFYNYSSASGHTGFEALGKSQLLLYRDVTTSLMTLITQHGIDGDGGGPKQQPSHVVQHLAGLPAGVGVAFADDDGGEFHLGAPGAAEGDWKFHQNTDGGGLSGLPLPGTWTVTVDSVFDVGIDTWRFLDPDEIPLTLTETAVLIASDQPSACRTDCTVPACGDGVLDGGEVCDDGNTVGGDGCSADCTALD